MDDKKEQTHSSQKMSKEDKIKQLTTVVCICKGIPLSRVLKGLPGSETVADVNQKVGTGSGGCAGERCGPRIKILLKKHKLLETKKKEKREI